MSSSRTLVLTPHYARHKVVGWQAAIVMVYKGTVDIVAEYEETVRSPSVEMKIPAVLRLKKPTPSMMRAVRFSKENVFARDGGVCQYCGLKLALLKATLDHVIPKSRGGRKNWENAVTACRPCNSRKGRKTPHEAGMTLRRLPFRPKTLPIAAFRVNVHRLPEEWKPFCEDVVLETG
jgi:5-methylcytosine-specific restriction endonuclease McrA